MTAILRIVLDQGTASVESDSAAAALELARGLVATAPSDCVVEAIVPGGAAGVDPATAIPGLASVERLTLGRRELLTAWQLGMPTGVGGGLIHAPSLAAPLVRHDRVHDNDQTVVTAWDLDAWEHAAELPRAHVLAQKALMKRAVKFADAIVVPTHAAAERLGSVARLGDRVRVIPGAPPETFRVPGDEIGRRRSLGIPEGFVLLAGTAAPSSRLAEGFAAVVRSGVDFPVVVIDAPEGSEPAIAELAAAAGLPEGRLHVRPFLEQYDRGAVFGGAVAFVAPAVSSRFPWRLVEALRLGVPVVAAESDVHREVVAEGGLLAAGDGEALGDALGSALGSTAAVERLGVLADDRGRAFSWAGAAERVWILHADL